MAKEIELEEKQDVVQAVISTLPESEQTAARQMLELIQLDGDGNVIYPDGTTGSHVSEHIKYHFKVPNFRRPLDAPEFAALISINNPKPESNGKTIKRWKKW